MSPVRLGRLEAVEASSRPDLLAAPVIAALQELTEAGRPVQATVAPIDPDLADTAAFCAAYDVALDASANCVVIAGRRGSEVRVAACMVLATTRADVNGIVRKRLDVRKASFMAMDDAVAATGMEYGGITPLGLPAMWPILVDPAVAALPAAVIGSGVRRSKIIMSGADLAALPTADVVEGLGRPTS
jgi:prolyl-tRNA editing enzyme YbaK/EbsC (Cys-tRNA(Pro) deacylase)